MARYNQNDYSNFAEGEASHGIDPRLSNLPAIDLGDDYVPARHARAQAPMAEDASSVQRVGRHQAASGYRVQAPAAGACQQQGAYSQASYQQQAPYAADPPNFQQLPAKKQHPLAKNIAWAVLAFVAVLLVAVLAYGLWFASQLDSALERTEVTPAVMDALEPPIPADGPFYTLVLGSDWREGAETAVGTYYEGEAQRSDVMMLVRIDLDARVVTMVSIPRDTPYTLDDGTTVKINELYNIGGAAASIKAVSELTGVPITHYAEVHFSELQQMVDLLGGVTVDVPLDLSYEDALTGEEVSVPAGIQTLSGQQALIFARARHEYADGQDAGRQSAVRQLATAIMKKVLDRPVADIPGTIIELAQFVGTDIRSGDLTAIGVSMVTGAGDLTVYSGTGPTDGGIDPATDLWLCYRNPEGWARLMEVVDSGGDPAGLYFDDTSIYW